MIEKQSRTWAEINLSALVSNFKKVKSTVNNKDVLCIIKADAYGHGSFMVAKTLEEAGADYFGVATATESIELRDNGIKTPILLLGYFHEDLVEEVIEKDITITVYSYETAKLLSHTAVKLGLTAKIHIKIDSGMSRLGFREDEIDEIIKISKLDGIYIEGIYTHFAVSDDKNPADAVFTRKQFEIFTKICNTLSENDVKIKIKHCANSGAVLQYDYTYFDMVRAGIVLYGYMPSDDIKSLFTPVMTLKTRVASVKNIKKGQSISYGRTETVDKDTKVAVLTVGYADGFPRIASSKAHVLVHGIPCKVIGRICMDMCMVDASAVPFVKQGDEAIIFGENLTADILAKTCDTIVYEQLCNISKRVPRLYK